MTFSPEDDLAVYNKLNEYSDMANDLNEEMTRNEEISIEEKEKIFFPMIDEMKEIAEEMIANYILFLKDEKGSIKTPSGIPLKYEKDNYDFCSRSNYSCCATPFRLQQTG